jgi:hypothetical protein
LANPIVNASMFITKSSISNGVMKWSAVNSDIEPDLYGERMSLDLYHKMLSYIKSNTPPPDNFKDLVVSDYWQGGMPYLSIAHYPDGNGRAVPGEPKVLYVDGKELKAKGILFDTPLGQAVWKSLKKDEIKTKSSPDADRIRISIAFLDLAHKHGDNGQVFHRNSLSDVCVECKNRIGDKIYVDGYLVHLALTTVPVNPRSIMQVERSMSKKIQTRKEDAISVVGDETLVEEIEKSNLETKSDILIEMSDTETVITEGANTATSPVVEEAKVKKVDEKMPEDVDEEDAEESTKDKAKKKCSLTEADIEVIRNLIVEVLPKPVEATLEVKSDTVSEPEVTKSVLDLATEKLYTSVKSAIDAQGISLEQKLESINPTLQELGNSITAMVRESMGELAPAPVSNEQTVILEAISNLTQKIENIALEVTTLKSQPTVNTDQKRIPAPRSISPALMAQSQAKPTNPNSVDNIARRSVSSQLPLK